MTKDIIIKGFTDIDYIPYESPADKSDLRDVRQLQVGFGSKVFRVDRDGLWAGAERFADAPFSVDWLGNLVANSVTLTGYIAVGGALADVGAGNITGTYIASGAITTSKLSATAIDGMTITGALIRTSSSGARVIMDDTTDALIIYDASAKRMQLNQSSLTFYTTGAVAMGSIYNSSNYLIIDTTSTSYATVFNINGTQKAAVTSAGFNLNDDLIMATSGIKIGSSSQGFAALYFQTGSTTRASASGEMRYYDSTSKFFEGYVNGFRGSFDLTAS